MAHRAGRFEGHVATRHALNGLRDDVVNGFHKLGLAECPLDYEVLARADDGNIETAPVIRQPNTSRCVCDRKQRRCKDRRQV